MYVCNFYDIGGIFTYFYGRSWDAIVANYYGEIGTDSIV